MMPVWSVTAESKHEPEEKIEEMSEISYSIEISVLLPWYNKYNISELLLWPQDMILNQKQKKQGPVSRKLLKFFGPKKTIFS